LLPPNAIRSAEVLATIGEPLLDLLADRPVRGTRQVVATIRAASLIGGDMGLRLIASLAARESDAVYNALIRAWPLFDPEEYARVVLSSSPHGRELRIEDPGLICALRYIPELNWLTVNFAAGHGNLSFIQGLPQLSNLNIQKDPRLHDLNPLGSHQALERLLLHCEGPLDLGPLTTLPKLSNLTFWPGKTVGVQILRTCANLSDICLMHPPAETPIAAMIPDRELQGFDLVGHDLADLSQLFGISQLASLKELVLSSCPQLSSLNGIERWSGSLRSFGLWNCGFVADLTPLTRLAGLEELYLTYGSPQDLSIVQDLPSLRRLHLDSEKPVELNALQGVAELTIYVRRRQRIYGAELLGDRIEIVRY
jgi:hypothetical protein